MKFRKLVAIFILALFSITSVANAAKKEDYTFSFKTLSGKNITMNTFVQGIHFKNAKNKIVLLDFFGNVCPPCLMEIPELIELQKEFKKDFQIIAFQVQTRISDDDLRAFVKEKGINYPVINTSDPKVFNFIDYITAKTSWKGLIPFAILFDKKGNATKVYLGMKSKAEFERDIKSLIK